jgi:8-oxo-dGTP diphosphatase
MAKTTDRKKTSAASTKMKATTKKNPASGQTRQVSVKKSSPGNKKTREQETSVVQKTKAPTSKKSAKTVAAKKTTVKKTTAKKTSSQKTKQKQSAQKNSVAKKTVPKKSAAKKTVSKKIDRKSISTKKTKSASEKTTKRPIPETPDIDNTSASLPTLPEELVEETLNEESLNATPEPKRSSMMKPRTDHRPPKPVAPPARPDSDFPHTTWGSGSSISFEPTSLLPPPEFTSIAGGFAFHDDKLVLANIPGRGWEIIGGRIDIGESPEETFRREAYEQVGVTFSEVKMIGVVRIEHTGPEPPNCPYPFPIGFGVQFIGIVGELHDFRGGPNSLGRSLITQEGFKEHYYEWDEFIDSVFKYAFSQYKKWIKKLKNNR